MSQPQHFFRPHEQSPAMPVPPKRCMEVACGKLGNSGPLLMRRGAGSHTELKPRDPRPGRRSGPRGLALLLLERWPAKRARNEKVGRKSSTAFHVSCSRWLGNYEFHPCHSTFSEKLFDQKSICQVTFKLANSGDNPTAEPGLQPTAFRLGASATLTILELLPDLTVPQSRPAPYPPRTNSRPFSLA
jgi:hypothetical protein